MSISFVAKGSNRAITSTTVTLAPGALLANDLIIVTSYCDTAGAITIADTLSTSYNLIASWVSATNARMWWGIVPAGGGSPTITVTGTSGSQNITAIVLRGTAVVNPTYNYAEFQDPAYGSGPWSCAAAGAIATGDAVVACGFQPYGVMQVGASAPNSDFTASTYAGGFCITGMEDNISWNGTTPTASFGNDGSSGTSAGAGLAIFGVKAYASDMTKPQGQWPNVGRFRRNQFNQHNPLIITAPSTITTADDTSKSNVAAVIENGWFWGTQSLKALSAKAGTSSSAKASMTVTKSFSAKVQTASSSKATRLNATKAFSGKVPTSNGGKATSVSYTHLTLPTKRIV